MAPLLSFAQLEQAALYIIRLVADIPGLENTRLAIIGDLAVAKYLPDHVRAASIDLVISKSSSPGRVRKEIVGHPITPLIEKSGAVFYKHTKGWEIEVKIIPDWLCPYLPDSAMRVKDVKGEASLPYTSLEDMIIFKMDACGLHENDSSKRRDACDAAALLERASEHGALKLDEDKTERAEEALADMVEFSGPEHDKNWWQRCLGMVSDKPRTPQEILSDLADQRQQQPTSPVSPTSSRSSVYSSISRASSYASTSSAHSTSSSISSIVPDDKPNPAEKNGRTRKMSITKKPKHKRHTSIGTLNVHMGRLDLDRPASPGVALTNRI
ncbi:hypothetical protein FALBO_1473 [Fusarium albosuccineum]|uniref:Uncharacterized protein n=2 Tax=Fusarium decemcellulare species complex TaxID=1329916 RepID=A0A8H4LPW0_9HYPO|nr:hypothetical protein FALBO_1473 [Fusarium albosuccineum]KAF4999060.1 hypothetical protein FDECE_11619 [Fusarium decemcellulare]